MAIARCESHGKPTQGVKVPYVACVKPIGYPKTSTICGRKGCENPAVVWLRQGEYTQYKKGVRVFRFPTYATQVKVV